MPAVFSIIALAPGAPCGAKTIQPCRVEVVDKETGWPVPLVELTTVHDVRFVSDNAGVIAIDLPELLGTEVWFTVSSPGYEVPPDGFGMRGVRLTPQPGSTLTVNVNRVSIAKRVGRLTGAGQFGESQKLGGDSDWKETGVFGCDSVQTARHNDRLFWIWGDTTAPRYPLGILHASGATSSAPLQSFEPPLRLTYDYFTDDQGRPRAVAQMPGPGPTWLGGLVSLPDRNGTMRLVAAYAKIKPPLEAYEYGLCVWDDDAERFERVRTIWTKSDESPRPPTGPLGQAVVVEDDGGSKWVLFCNPLPKMRCRATYEAWQDQSAWESLKPADHLVSASDGSMIKSHAGSIAWIPHLQRYVAIFVQIYGKPSMLGEIWYAEAPSAYGPWGPAVKVLSHEKYSFYNPRIQPELTPDDAPFLLFEGTYTKTFSGETRSTPRYDYNQVLYRLDLDDPQLAPARYKAAEPAPRSSDSTSRP